jgi:hypothetical protein
MANKYFNFTNVLGYGWRTMKQDLWFFVGVGIIWVAVSAGPDIVRAFLKRLPLPEPSGIVLGIALIVLGWIIAVIINIGITKIALSFCDEQKPPLGTLFDAFDCFWRYVGTMILYGLIILGGFILLIVPGIIWAVQFSLSYYFVVDRGLGPIQALKASSRTTNGVKWDLLGFGILCGLMNLLGFLCLIVGIFATYPTVLVATALVYRQLAAQTPQLAEFGIAAPGTRPPPVSPPLEPQEQQ